MNQWKNYGQVLVDQLGAGKKIFIHCKGGLGRTGTIAACLLIESGMKHLEAIDSVRSARQNTIETTTQEFFVLTYEARFL